MLALVLTCVLCGDVVSAERPPSLDLAARTPPALDLVLAAARPEGEVAPPARHPLLANLALATGIAGSWLGSAAYARNAGTPGARFVPDTIGATLGLFLPMAGAYLAGVAFGESADGAGEAVLWIGYPLAVALFMPTGIVIAEALNGRTFYSPGWGSSIVGLLVSNITWVVLAMAVGALDRDHFWVRSGRRPKPNDPRPTGWRAHVESLGSLLVLGALSGPACAAGYAASVPEHVRAR